MGESAPRKRRVFVLLAALSLSGLGALGGYGYSVWAGLRGAAVRRTVTTLRETSSVVAAVRELSNLETVSFHMERVIDLRERTSQLFGLVQAEDAILLVAAADVVAGIDLSGLAEADVQVDQERRGVRVLLPPPQVLSARLDNARTYVHTRATDALARRSESLETRARQAAERVLRQAAIDAGLLSRARLAGTRAVEGLLRSLGFAQVSVEFRDE